MREGQITKTVKPLTNAQAKEMAKGFNMGASKTKKSSKGSATKKGK